MVQRVVVVDKDMGLNKILADLEKLSKAEVLVGIQAGSKTKVDTIAGRQQVAGINIAGYAAQNEFGTDTIPERSFLRSFFDQNLNIIEPFVERVCGRIIDDQITIEQGLGIIGTQMQDGVKEKIRQIRTPPNSPRTIAKKRSSKPLIDFGQMIAAVRYVVKLRKR